MQLSTNLPYGFKAVQKHIGSGVSLPMNVTPEADAAFMRELQREDSQRRSIFARRTVLHWRRPTGDSCAAAGRRSAGPSAEDPIQGSP